MSKMRLVQVTRPNGPLEMVEREIPEPGAGQVRIKVEACGICHSDSMTKEGLWPGIQYPRVPGHEVAGVVDAVGAALPDGRKANGSESVGTAGIAGTVILAGAAILLLAKSRPKFPVSPTTAATPNT